jgi:hypothetical protein
MIPATVTIIVVSRSITPPVASGVADRWELLLSEGTGIKAPPRPGQDTAPSRRYTDRTDALDNKEDSMPKDLVMGGLPAAVVAAALLAGAPAPAEAKSKQVDQITCEEFLALDADDQQRIAYWVDGYATAKGEAAVGTVALDKFGEPIGELVADCKATPKETLWQKLKTHLHL